MTFIRPFSAILLCCSVGASAAPFQAVPTTQAVPPAVINDPVSDPNNLPRMILAPMPTHGTNIPAMFYTAGPGKHPTFILFTGLPGAEINSDLMYAVRRAGWNVVTFHYRGSWGSAGKFSLAHCLEDGQAAVDWVGNAADPQLAPFIDPGRIVLGGHSTGGWIAAYVAAHDPKILGAAMISGGVPTIPPGTPRDQAIAAAKGMIESAGMQLLDATPKELADELSHASPDMAPLGNGLDHRALLVITANDGLAPFNDALADSAAKAGAKVTRVHFDTNHGYNDRRIALAAALVRWLETIPGAPR